MPYYRGDYYRGDYYRGDPGFFSFLGGVAKSVVGMIPGVGGALASLIPSPAAKVARAALPAAAAAGLSPLMKRVGGGIMKHPVLSAAGAAGVVGAAGALAGHAMAGGGCPKGFHTSKKNGHCVRNRHMRVTNPRALRRSIRRATGFAKLAMRTIHLVHPKKRGRFGGFKKKRR